MVVEPSKWHVSLYIYVLTFKSIAYVPHYSSVIEAIEHPLSRLKKKHTKLNKQMKMTFKWK